MGHIPFERNNNNSQDYCFVLFVFQVDLMLDVVGFFLGFVYL